MADPFNSDDVDLDIETGALPEDEDEQEDWDEEHNDLLYLKYAFEGAATVPELSAALRWLADQLDSKSAGGWRLDAPVDGGFAHLVRDRAG